MAGHELKLAEIDLTDTELYVSGDPHAVWRYLRAHEPVFWNPQRRGPGFWVVTRHDDIRRVSRDTATFISSGGTSTMDLEQPKSASLDYQIMQGTLVISDPPRHTKLRALVNKAFTPQAVARVEPFIREVVAGILEEIIARGECDFVADVAAKLPFVVICELLGVPGGERAAVFESIRPMMTTQAVLAAADGAEGSMNAALGLIDYTQRLVDERTLAPREDLISDVVRAEIDGERLTRADSLALCILLFVAGSETTMNALSGGMLAFIEHPTQLERLRTDRGLFPTAVEEILRWTTPTMVGMIRTGTQPAEIRGRAIAPGQKVTLWYSSANRDEDVFDDPYRFDVGRSPNDHLTFGFGAHFCLGAGLARLEIRVVFDELLRRAGSIDLAGDVVRLRSNIMSGLERMPVAIRPA